VVTGQVLVVPVIDPEVFGGTGFCSGFPGGDSSWITVLVLVGPVVR